MTAKVPASGDLKTGGLNHYTLLQDGVYIQNADTGA